MYKISVMTRDGAHSFLPATEGFSLMETIRNAGHDELFALCGGSCSCATCHIYVHADDVRRLPPMAEDERHLLSTSAYVTPRSRLACQVMMSPDLNGLAVQIAPAD